VAVKPMWSQCALSLPDIYKSILRHVTDNAHLSHDLGADWLDRLELLLRLEDLTGVEITHNEADQIEYVGDLIQHIGEKQLYCAGGHWHGRCDGEFRPASI
jgi:acyl carrier protein